MVHNRDIGTFCACAFVSSSLSFLSSLDCVLELPPNMTVECKG